MPQEDNKFKIVMLIIFAGLMLAGIIVFATYKSSGSKTSQVQISIWGTINQQVFNDFEQKYMQDNTKSMNVTYTEKSIDTIDGDLVEALATGQGPDVILVPQDLEKRYLDKVYLMTSILPRTIQDTYIQESNLYLQASGTFALPFVVDPMVMYWNKDLFLSAAIPNPPQTWSEFPLLTDKLTKSDASANITQSLASLGEYRNVDNAKALVSTLLLQSGTTIVGNDNGTFQSTLYGKASSDVAEPAVLAMNFFADYANPKKVVYSWNRSLPSSKLFFLSENLATYFGFASEYDGIKAKNPNLNFDVAMMPQIVDAKDKTTFGELYGFSIMKNSPNLVAAFQKISELTSAGPVSEFVQVSDFAPARLDLIAQGTKNPAKSIFFNSALISKGWIDPDRVKTDQIFQEMVENISTGRMRVDGAVQNASDKINNLL